MSIFDSGYDNLKDHARRSGVSETPRVTGWSEVHDVTSDFFKQEMLSTSEQMMIGDEVNNAVDLFSSLNPNKKENKLDFGNTKVKGLGGVFAKKQILEDNHQAILDLQLQYPDAGLKTIDDIMKDAQDKARLTREKMQSATENTSFMGKVGMLTGGIEGFLHDPILVGSMLLGTKKITGPSKAVNAWKAFKTEAAIGAGAEMLITPSVMSWKNELDSPYSLKEAAINILTVGGFAGVTRAGGSYVVDVFEARKAVKSLRASGENAKADVVESYADLQERGGTNPDAHIQAYMKAQQAIQRGEIVNQSDLDKVTGGNLGIEVLDPSGIKVDADTFQFKAHGDKFGVTDRLQGIKKWDSIKAGTSIVWERADGARFIADGHQRLALAKRLIGEDAQEIGLNAFIMREADGYTAEAVRDIAAFKNIAEGSGSALDAAKVIRSGNSLGDDLPPNSALVRDARGLSKLDDASFRFVIDEKIDAKYGAIVGELISNADEQAAVIRSLMKAKPANANQARIMVGDMKAAGFTKTETQDLFGGMEITESLFKERAKVIDSAMRQIKKDKSVFKTLAEQESRIAGAGNKLDRDANLLRLSDDEKTLAAITSLANAKGPVSDAINDAARRVKSGESIQRATGDILPELRRSTEPGSDVRPNRDGAGDGHTTLAPEKGTPVRLVGLNAKARRGVELEFKSKQKGYTVKQYYDAAKGPQKEIVKIGKELSEALGDEIAFLSPGVKKLEEMRGKIKRKGYKDASNFTDVCRCGFAVKDASNIKAIINRISKDYEILDEGLAEVTGGYFDQKILVRFDNGIVGEVQIWEPHLLAAKEGSEFVEQLFPDHLKAFISDMDIPAKNKSGHALYDQQKKLVYRGKVKKGKQPEYDQIDKEMDSVYASAKKSANASWKSGLDSSRPDSRISTGEARSQSSLGTAENQPSSNLSEGVTNTAGRPSQSKNAETSLKSNDVINQTSKDIIPKDTNSIKLNDKLKDTGLDLDDPYLNELHVAELKQVDDLLAKHGDMEIPTGARLDADGEEVIEFRSAKEVMKELDDEQKVIDDMFKCMGA